MVNKFKLPSINVRNRYNLFKVLLISYMLILAIPIIIGSLSYFQSSRILKEQIGNYNISMLEQSAQIIDGYLYSVDQLLTNMALAPQIQNSLYLRKPLTPENSYGIYKAVEEISMFKGSNNIVDNLFVYLKNSDCILSYSGKYDTEFYYDQFVPHSEYGYENWKEELSEICYKKYTPVKSLPKNDSSIKIFSCRQSLPLGEKNSPLGISVAWIDAKKMESLLGNIDVISQGEVYMLDSTQNIIMSIGNDRYGSPEILNAKLSGDSQYFNYIGREEVLVSRVPSRYNHWEYISVIPTRTFMSKVNSIKLVTVIIIAVEILLGILLSVWLARKNYLPVKRLMDKLEKKLGKKYTLGGNELAFIEEITDATITENEEIKESMSRQQPIIRANTLMQLLSGNISGMKNILESLQSFGICFSGDRFVVMAIHIDDCSGFVKDNSFDQTAIIKFVINNAAEELLKIAGYKPYPIDINLYETAIIIETQEESGLCIDKLSKTAQRLNEFMAENFSTLITIGIGTQHDGINGINLSYLESAKAAEYKIVRGQGSVISFENLCHTSNGYTYPTAVETQLINYIKVGDTQKALNLLDEIFTDNFENNKISVEIGKCLFFDIMSTALKVLDDVDIDYNSVFEEDFSPISRILSCQTADEMYKTLKKFYKTICEYISQNKKSHNEDLRDRILDYLNRNYNDSSLSLTIVADALKINPSYLSYFFKKQTGENFVDYLNKTRIEKATTLLESTSLSLFEISEKVGYSNYSCLIRIFKKFYGTTPGNYRETLLKKA